jgi:nucleoside-diphosphate-sugar epimerase
MAELSFVTYQARNPDTRLLITGGTGWFGRNVISMATNLGMNYLVMGSGDKEIIIDGKNTLVREQNFQEIREFEPTIIVDTAFLTREKLESLGRDQFISVNRKLMKESLEMASLPSVRKYVGFSSGATMNLSGQTSFSLHENPYAALKREYEAGMTYLSRATRGNISIARVWSVTGDHMTKPELFAFSNLISQARTGRIIIKAKNLVFRRYCTINEVISVALANSGSQGAVFDTGGELIEIGDLAEIIRQEINPEAEIFRELHDGIEPDNYFSDGKVWGQLLSESNIKPASVREQVRTVANGMGIRKS